MTSARQIIANRLNAQRSTGPRSISGRDRSGRNALKHGLNLPVRADPKSATQIDQLAQALAGAHAHDPAVMAQARAVAEASYDLTRIRLARVRAFELMSSHLERLETDHLRLVPDGLLARAITTRSAAVEERIATLMAAARPMPNRTRDERDSEVLRLAVKSLSVLERYERRAFSRRQRAVRALDLALEASAAQHSII